MIALYYFKSDRIKTNYVAFQIFSKPFFYLVISNHFYHDKKKNSNFPKFVQNFQIKFLVLMYNCQSDSRESKKYK